MILVEEHDERGVEVVLDGDDRGGWIIAVCTEFHKLASPIFGELDPADIVDSVANFRGNESRCYRRVNFFFGFSFEDGADSNTPVHDRADCLNGRYSALLYCT